MNAAAVLVAWSLTAAASRDRLVLFTSTLLSVVKTVVP